MNNSSSAVSIAETLGEQIASLPAGTRIATHRELVGRFSVSATTVSDALALLTQRGLVVSRPGAGTFRSQTPTVPRAGDTAWQAAALELSDSIAGGDARRGFKASALLGTLTSPGAEVIDLNGGYLHPGLQPMRLLGAALSRVARRPEGWDRPPPAGLPELRDWFAADIGGGLSRDNVLICGGGQNALSTALRALGQPGDPVVLESPTYPGTMAAAHAAGLRIVPVPLDEHGMHPDYLDDALARTRARVLVVQPLYQNPTGASLTPDRRRQIREIARRHEAFVIEDDFAHHLRHSDAPPAPSPLVVDDPDGSVIHIRSLTKVTSPNLRVGALAARGPVMARLRAALVIDAMFVPGPLQYTALEIVTSSGWQRALSTLGAALQQRRDIAVGAVTDVFGSPSLSLRPKGGYHLWVELPADLTGVRFEASALTRGVAVTAGENYYPTDGNASHIRVSYVSAPSSADIDDGIRRLSGSLTDTS